MEKKKIIFISILLAFGLFAEIGERGIYGELFKFIDSKRASSEYGQKSADTWEERLQRLNDIIIDKRTGLIWQDNAAAKSIRKSWKEAVEYCSNLSLDGYTDWRLPSYDELLSIIDYDRSDPSIVSSFKNAAPLYYWSSSQSVDDPGKAWHVSFRLGYTDRYDKSSEYYVRCARGREPV
jgi:hypothetical protein